MIVQTQYGKIQGIENQSVIGDKKYLSFYGIPYAKPPIDNLRFSAPVPPEKWDNIYDAKYERDNCCQLDFQFRKTITGFEDCLYLNIHVPEINPNSLKPVLFFIHGGGFFAGSGNENIHGADYFMEHDVVLVTINYRLHIFGFLNLGIPECPGNAGLKDQLAALKWVKENIKAFGGDPDNITIDGCSAGASSVNLLMISPLAKGLFQKAILQSGTSTSSWSITYDPVKWAFKAGRRLGYTGEDRLELLNILKTTSILQLTLVALELVQEITRAYPARRAYSPFAPSVEAIKEGAFLPDFPHNLSNLATPVPCIVGHNEMEVVYIGRHFAKQLSNDPDQSLIREIIKSNFEVTEDQLLEKEQQLREFYFEQNDPDKPNLEKIYELLSDLITFQYYDSFEFVNKSNVPMYLYHFTYYSEQGELRQRLGGYIPFLKKAHHAEEMAFLFFPKIFRGEPLADGISGQARKNMCQLWVNFLKTGDPTSENLNVKWNPSTIDESCYLQIDAELKPKKGKINENRIKFLKNIFRDVELIK